MQAQRPVSVLNLRFMKGSITFVGLSTATAASKLLMEGGAAAAAKMRQQAGLPEQMRAVLSEQGVFLPHGVSKELATSPDFFALAHQHRVSAGVWVRNSMLRKVLTHFMNH